MNTALLRKLGQSLGMLLVATGAAAVDAQDKQHIADSTERIEFSLTPTQATAAALPDAWAKVTITQNGANQVLEINLGGLPPNVGFRLFNTQIPKPPFGLSWYDGTVATDAYGNAHESFVGRFNADSFIVSLGEVAAPVLHNEHNVPDGTPDADKGPTTNPIHTLHLGLWFPSLKAAAESGIDAAKPTPFNGKHNAGPLAFSSSDFEDTAGPLIHLKQP